MRSQVAISATLIFILVLSSSGAVQAQLMPARRNAINLTTSPIAGTTPSASAFGTHLSYRLNNNWDLLLGSDTLAGLSLLSVGGRYYIPNTSPNVRSYLAAELLTAGTGTGFLLGAGASVALAPNWTVFSTVGLVSGPGGSTTGYDFGIQLDLSRQFSLVVGTSNVFTSGATYFGLSIGLPEP